jgi:hypothetical protein
MADFASSLRDERASVVRTPRTVLRLSWAIVDTPSGRSIPSVSCIEVGSAGGGLLQRIHSLQQMDMERGIDGADGRRAWRRQKSAGAAKSNSGVRRLESKVAQSIKARLRSVPRALSCPRWDPLSTSRPRAHLHLRARCLARSGRPGTRSGSRYRQSPSGAQADPQSP